METSALEVCKEVRAFMEKYGVWDILCDFGIHPDEVNKVADLLHSAIKKES